MVCQHLEPWYPMILHLSSDGSYAYEIIYDMYMILYMTLRYVSNEMCLWYHIYEIVYDIIVNISYTHDILVWCHTHISYETYFTVIYDSMCVWFHVWFHMHMKSYLLGTTSYMISYASINSSRACSNALFESNAGPACPLRLFVCPPWHQNRVAVVYWSISCSLPNALAPPSPLPHPHWPLRHAPPS